MALPARADDYSTDSCFARIAEAIRKQDTMKVVLDNGDQQVRALPPLCSTATACCSHLAYASEALLVHALVWP